MNILLIGKNGQVGQELSRSLAVLGNLYALGKAELDLLNPQAIKNTLAEIAPQVIVNAAAYTAVDKAETDIKQAYSINHEALIELADYAQRTNAILFHYSTDYVFDGSNHEPYLEGDVTNPLNVYGASKLAGEQAILDSHCQGYIFRTTWVYSLTGHNFIKTILNLAKHKETLSIVADQKGVPTSAKLINDVTLLAIKAALQQQLHPGIYHLTPSGATTWYDIACYTIERALSSNISLKIDPDKINPIPSEDYPLPAERPKNSLLNNQLLSKSLQISLPDWKFHLNHFISQFGQLGYQ